MSGGGYGYDKPSYGSHGGYDEHDHKYESSDDYDNKPKYDDGHGYKEESYGYKPKYDEYKPEPYGYKPMYEEYGYKRPSYGGYHNYGKLKLITLKHAFSSQNFNFFCVFLQVIDPMATDPNTRKGTGTNLNTTITNRSTRTNPWMIM